MYSASILLHLSMPISNLMKYYSENAHSIFKIILTSIFRLWYDYYDKKSLEVYYMGNVQETKRDKFVRLAEARTNKIIDMIQLLGNCSNQSQYEYTQKDVTKIFNAIQAELDAAKKRFNKQESQKGSKFKLD